MKRLLIVAPAFPPHPSPATHRARFLCRYAPERGWECEVLTVRPEYYEESLDNELAALVAPGTRITRVGALPARLTRMVGVGDLGLRSYHSLRGALKRLCAERRPDVIFIPGGPFYPFLLGAVARREFDVPYVLDFTDPWVYPPRPEDRRVDRKAYWSYALANALEPGAVRPAAHVLAVSDGTNDGIRIRYPDLPADRFSAVPFGFEADDFTALRESPRPLTYWDRADGMLHLAYVGAMLPNGYETLRALFEAVRLLRAESAGVGPRLRLHFFGTTYDPVAERGLVVPVAEEMGLGEVVTEHPRRIPYMDALNVLTSANGVLALGSTDHHYTASKIFPCILARRPLLAVYHEASTVCDIVRETNAGDLVTYSDAQRAQSRVREIAEALRRMLGPGAYDPAQMRPAALDQYSARVMSGRIIDLFDEIAGTGAAERPVGEGALASGG